ncbi:bifunctional UDP-sugar hydrolase/5'-nucleotidase [Curtobacterium sp. MCJR17_043]|uniref:bifunctional metallophosphatase/5'-nucleotidase n=1 Tax=Curtobacterium sp. MCJR17_043 TaxID=2175660 RepID=UPI0024E00D22|nr:bifunctional UDP-sugar hydrolase/5'-nucleotidase [Curtobacterium sp. MCJR17_043]WIB35550.1 bifunctional UDP-sugar hydrolase/5'-nucleotidase [Curtobacterium sp. MCJR17_043]
MAAAGDTTIDILDVNDFHGRIESEGTAADKAAGAAKLAAVVQAQREANPNTIFASVGDNVGASTFTSFVQQDDPTIDVLNQMRLDVSAIGNHELDKGQDDLTGRIEDRADWPYISANIVKQGTTEPAFTPWSIVEKGGVKVGFIGATTEALIPGLVSPGGVEGLAMAPIVSSVNRYATELTDGDEANGEADVLVLLVHEGATTGALTDATGSGAFGQITAGVSSEVSAIVSAHTHATYDHSIPGPDGTPRPVIQAGSYGVAYGHLRMTVAADGTLTSITSSVKPVNTDPAKPADTTSVDAVTKTVADAKAVADVKGKEQLGTITGDLRRALQSDGKTENRGGESTLGNNIAEVQRWATERQGSQVAFMNPGGLRTDLVYASSGAGDPDGSVSYKEAALVQPFANTLVTEDMTGQQIKDALEQQWQPDGLERPFLKLGVSEGFAYTYDPSKGRGERITGMTLDGEPIALDETLKVTVNSFLSTGGDNFAAFAAGTNKADSGQVDLQAQADYFAAQDAVEPPDGPARRRRHHDARARWRLPARRRGDRRPLVARLQQRRRPERHGLGVGRRNGARVRPDRHHGGRQVRRAGPRLADLHRPGDRCRDAGRTHHPDRARTPRGRRGRDLGRTPRRRAAERTADHAGRDRAGARGPGTR